MPNVAVRVKDLQDHIGKTGPHPLLLCCVCGGEYSANVGDYFLVSPETVLKCCGLPMTCVFKRTIYEVR